MSRFCKAVTQIPGLNPNDCRPGLQALNSADRKRILCEDPRSLEGSVCLDAALKHKCPRTARWDYGIGMRKGRNILAIWVEVHPARSGDDVQSVLAKALWLKERLHASSRLRTMTQKPFHWIASGKVKIPKTGSWSRQLKQNGISHPQEMLRLP